MVITMIIIIIIIIKIIIIISWNVLIHFSSFVESLLKKYTRYISICRDRLG